MKYLLLIVTLPLFYACSTPPLLSLKYEETPLSLVRGGEKAFSNYKKKWRIVDNKQVNRVANNLQRVLPNPDHGWEFKTFALRTPNAFALPGGKIGINTGVLPHAKNDAQIATILSHEAAHIIKNHHAERDQRQHAIELINEVYKANPNDLDKMEEIKKELLLGLPNNVEMEMEADLVGLIYMAKAGYDPREGVQFWLDFARYKEENNLNKAHYIKTHPLDTTRISNLNKILPLAIIEYWKSPYRNQINNDNN